MLLAKGDMLTYLFKHDVTMFCNTSFLIVGDFLSIIGNIEDANVAKKLGDIMVSLVDILVLCVCVCACILLFDIQIQTQPCRPSVSKEVESTGNQNSI